jgi:hypothetical protein
MRAISRFGSPPFARLPFRPCPTPMSLRRHPPGRLSGRHRRMTDAADTPAATSFTEPRFGALGTTSTSPPPISCGIPTPPASTPPPAGRSVAFTAPVSSPISRCHPPPRRRDRLRLAPRPPGPFPLHGEQLLGWLSTGPGSNRPTQPFDAVARRSRARSGRLVPVAWASRYESMRPDTDPVLSEVGDAA